MGWFYNYDIRCFISFETNFLSIMNVCRFVLTVEWIPGGYAEAAEIRRMTMNKEVEALKAKIAALEGEVKTLRGENLKLYDKLGRKPSVGEKEVARMQKLREEGMTLRQIADDMNVSTSTVYRYLTEENRLKSTRARTPLYRNRF